MPSSSRAVVWSPARSNSLRRDGSCASPGVGSVRGEASGARSISRSVPISLRTWREAVLIVASALRAVSGRVSQRLTGDTRVEADDHWSTTTSCRSRAMREVILGDAPGCLGIPSHLRPLRARHDLSDVRASASNGVPERRAEPDCDDDLEGRGKDETPTRYRDAHDQRRGDGEAGDDGGPAVGAHGHGIDAYRGGE